MKGVSVEDIMYRDLHDVFHRYTLHTDVITGQVLAPCSDDDLLYGAILGTR